MGTEFNTKLGVFLWKRQLSGCSRHGPSRVGLTEGPYVKVCTGLIVVDLG